MSFCGRTPLAARDRWLTPLSDMGLPTRLPTGWQWRTSTDGVSLSASRRSVSASFALNGFFFASPMSRTPDVCSDLAERRGQRTLVTHSYGTWDIGAGRFMVSPVLNRVGRPSVLPASAICVAGIALWRLGAAAGCRREVRPEQTNSTVPPLASVSSPPWDVSRSSPDRRFSECSPTAWARCTRCLPSRPSWRPRPGPHDRRRSSVDVLAVPWHPGCWRAFGRPASVHPSPGSGHYVAPHGGIADVSRFDAAAPG